MVVCTVIAGDRPLVFNWLKNGKVLQSDNNVKATSNAEFSTLNFGSLALSQSGNYTCAVRNNVGTASFEAALVVHCECGPSG